MNEVLVYSAHLDHLGIGEPEGDDRIYNGAMDNASGVAAILEIARGFAALPTPPPRSILFLAVTAEEKGLVGSDYFASHPTVPLESIVANINIDGLVPLFEMFEVVARGMEHSTLEGHVRAAAGVAGIAVGEDPVPEQVIFIRSDQYSFASRGVPAIFPGVGLRDATGGAEANGGRLERWFRERYHSPSDEWDDAFRPVWLEKEARLYFLIGLSVASDEERPRWRPDSPFARAPAP
jgi:Zn-dependent M28 family amino/carboxypeptidase